MTHYRIYYMNTVSGHIDSAEDIDLACDEESINLAQVLSRDKPIEVWCGTRKVHRFEAPCRAPLALTTFG